MHTLLVRGVIFLVKNIPGATFILSFAGGLRQASSEGNLGLLSNLLKNTQLTEFN